MGHFCPILAKRNSCSIFPREKRKWAPSFNFAFFLNFVFQKFLWVYIIYIYILNKNYWIVTPPAVYEETVKLISILSPKIPLFHPFSKIPFSKITPSTKISPFFLVRTATATYLQKIYFTKKYNVLTLVFAIKKEKFRRNQFW